MPLATTFSKPTIGSTETRVGWGGSSRFSTVGADQYPSPPGSHVSTPPLELRPEP
jgi:hypothetical protein